MKQVPSSSYARGYYPKRAGRGRRQQHALKSRGKAKGPRALDVALNQRLASWQVAAINAGAPSSAGVEYYLAEYLGWVDEADCEDEEEVRDEECYVLRYTCWEDEGYGEPEAYGGAVGDEECYVPEFQGWEGEGLAAEWGVEGVPLDGVRMWGMRVASADHNVDVMEQEVTEGAIAEAEEDGEELEEEEEAARISHYEMMVKWKKRQQKRKNMKWKQQRKKHLLPGSVSLCHKRQEDDDEEEEEAAEEEEHHSDIYQHTKKMKQQQERRTLDDDDNEEDQEEGDCMEPGEMLQKEVEDRERVTSTEREREDAEGVVAKEQQETGVEEVEQQGPDDDFGFCKMGFAWDYVEEEDWYVVGGVVEM